jgi:hypothetical protein
MAPKKKIEMPTDIYSEEPAGAIQKLTGESQAQAAQSAQSAKAGPIRNVKPTSFYLTPEQLRKLDDLAYTYNGRTGKRINRNDIIRWLVDVADIGSLQGL